MTRVLIITSKEDLTSDFIVERLRQKNIEFYRLNTEELLKSINLTFEFQSKSYRIHDKNLNVTIDFLDFGAVYFRRPKVPEFDTSHMSDEERDFLRKELIYILEGIYKFCRDAFWVSPLYAIRQAENKIYQLEIAQSLGFSIPHSLISNSYEECRTFHAEQGGKCVIKPIRSGLIEGDKKSSVIYTSELNKLPRDRDRIESFPVFIQEEIEKRGDVRVVVVGDKIFATFIHSQDQEVTKTDWRRGQFNLKHSMIKLPSSVASNCITLLKRLDLKFGAIDLVIDTNGEFVFLEINPNGQWGWIENKTDHNISSAIVELLQHGIS